MCGSEDLHRALYKLNHYYFLLLLCLLLLLLLLLPADRTTAEIRLNLELGLRLCLRLRFVSINICIITHCTIGKSAFYPWPRAIVKREFGSNDSRVILKRLSAVPLCWQKAVRCPPYRLAVVHPDQTSGPVPGTRSQASVLHQQTQQSVVLLLGSTLTLWRRAAKQIAPFLFLLF